MTTLSHHDDERLMRFLSATPMAGASLAPLPGDASFRRYVRVYLGQQTAMLMDAPPEREALAPFVQVAEWLCQHGYSAPQMIARDDAQGLMLLEDLGVDSLTNLCRTHRQMEPMLYEVAVDVLADWALGAATGRLSSPPLPRYDHALMMREVMLFSEWFLPQIISDATLAERQAEFSALWERLISDAELQEDVFVHRDFHADNLLWRPERSHLQRLGLLDFQDAVLGDPAYDLVSLIEDARRDVGADLAAQLLDRYLAATGFDRPSFLAKYSLLGAQRNCKIVGIFVRLAVRDGKAHYLNYLPRVWAHLNTDLAHEQLRPLAQWMQRVVPEAARSVPALRPAAPVGAAAGLS